MAMSRKRIQFALAILTIVGSVWYGYRQLVPAKPDQQARTDVVRHLPKEIRDALPSDAVAVLDGVEMLPAVVGPETRVAAETPLSSPIESGQIGDIQSHFRGNGRDVLTLTASNRGAMPATLRLKEGTLFEAGDDSVVLLRSAELEIPAGETRELELETAATSMRNAIGDREFTRSRGWLPTLDPLLDYLQTAPEVTTGAAQTAVLALTEDAPIDIFAKFQRLHPMIPVGVDKDAFRVTTSEILGALMLLRDSGIPVSGFSIASDPQLKIEAMIDEQARDAATEYFQIAKDAEWSFWKSELLEGAIATRHYALYGIAQNYSDVALTMLPSWAREKRLRKIYRLSAVRALAMTERAEAIPILRDLLDDVRIVGETEIERSALHAIRYLEYQAAKASESVSGKEEPGIAQTAAASGNAL
jgi:hypothetical protein